MSDQHPPQDPLELLKRMWAPMSLPIPGMVAPLADVGEIEKRIADLKSVEQWLTLNLSMVKMSVQGLEMQKATVSTLQAAQQAVGIAASETHEAGAPPQNPLEVWWSLLQQAPISAPPAPPAPPRPESKKRR